MLAGVPLPRVLGMIAGVLILAVGAFVLAAKPRSRLHQLFFALAATDGVSTFALDLAFSPVDEFVRVNALNAYFLTFVPFVLLLALFGARFPRPLLRGRSALAATAAGIVGAGSLWVAQALDPSTLWTASRGAGGALDLRLSPLAVGLNALFLLVVALVLTRMVLVFRHERSATHRRQGALLLGGMALGYAPVGTTVAVAGLERGLAQSFLRVGPSSAVYWASLAVTAATIFAIVRLSRDHRSDRRTERTVVLVCLLLVALLTAVGAVDPSSEQLAAIRAIGLLAWPAFLGYAILRYEVLDIDARLRRATTASLIGASLTGVFLAFEITLENVLQNAFEVRAVSSTLSVVLAAALAAAASIPLAKLVRRLASRVLPEPPDREEARRKEIYMHALEGAAGDGIMTNRELQLLARLRASLGISDAEHDRMVREISERAA